MKNPDASYNVSISVHDRATDEGVTLDRSQVAAAEVSITLGRTMAAIVNLFDPGMNVQLVTPDELADAAAQAADAQASSGDETRVTNEVLHRAFSALREVRGDVTICLRRGDMPSQELMRNVSHALTEAYRILHNLTAPVLGGKSPVPVLSANVGDVVPVRLGFDGRGRSVWRDSTVSIQPQGAVGCVLLKPQFSFGELDRMTSLTPGERSQLQELQGVQARLETTKAVLDETSSQLTMLVDVVDNVASVGTPPDPAGPWEARCWICRLVFAGLENQKAAYQRLAAHLKNRCWLSEWRMNKFAEVGAYVDAADVHVGDEVRVEFAGADGAFPEFDYEKASGEDLEGIGSAGFTTGIVTSYGDDAGLGIDEEGTLLVAPPNGPARRIFLIERGPEGQALAAIREILISEGAQSQMLSLAFERNRPDGMESNPRLSAAENVVLALEEWERTARRRGSALAQLGHAAGFPTPKSVGDETATFRAMKTVIEKRRQDSDAPLADLIRAALKASEYTPEFAKRPTTDVVTAVGTVMAELEIATDIRREITRVLLGTDGQGILDDPAGFDAGRLATIARLVGLDVITDDGKKSGLPIRVARPDAGAPHA